MDRKTPPRGGAFSLRLKICFGQRAIQRGFLIHSAVHKTPRSASSAIARSSFALSLSGSCSASRRYLTARGLLIADSETPSVLARSGGFKHLPDPFRALVRKRMFSEPAQCNRDLPQFVPSLAGWQLSGLSQGLRGPF
jgi:hypothetical protein